MTTFFLTWLRQECKEKNCEEQIKDLHAGIGPEQILLLGQTQLSIYRIIMIALYHLSELLQIFLGVVFTVIT